MQMRMVILGSVFVSVVASAAGRSDLRMRMPMMVEKPTVFVFVVVVAFGTVHPDLMMIIMMFVIVFVVVSVPVHLKMLTVTMGTIVPVLHLSVFCQGITVLRVLLECEDHHRENHLHIAPEKEEEDRRRRRRRRQKKKEK